MCAPADEEAAQWGAGPAEAGPDAAKAATGTATAGRKKAGDGWEPANRDPSAEAVRRAAEMAQRRAEAQARRLKKEEVRGMGPSPEHKP